MAEIKSACGEDLPEIELYRLYRDYIRHEDSLINNRVGWFIQLHSFLIASYGIVFAALVATFFPQQAPLVAPIWPQLIAGVLLVGIAVIGLESSAAARLSILAGDRAITALETAWKRIFEQRGGGDILPHVIGGGDKGDKTDGAEFHMRLPRALQRLWLASFLVPAAFAVLAITA